MPVSRVDATVSRDGTPAADDGTPAADVEFVAIAAVAANGVIGDGEGMPWHLPAELRHFEATTTGHPVVLGRVTHETIVDRLGGPLPDRTSVVLTTRDRPFEGDRVVAVGSVADAARAAAVDAAERGVETAYVAGGASVYEAFLPGTDRLLLSELHDAHEGSVRFPDRDRTAWRERDRERREGFDVVEYERVDAPEPLGDATG